MITITPQLVARLIEAQFPQWADLPIRPVLPGGHDNRTFHLGEDMTVRLPSAARYATQPHKEWTWLPRLQPHLPLPIPVPLALGAPAEGYPYEWTVCPWIGETACAANIADKAAFARDLAAFLRALYAIDAGDGPPAGQHNFYRGGDLAVYDAEARAAIGQTHEALDIPSQVLTKIWETALSSRWACAPVWVHGDVAITNLIAAGGRLAGVLDFGSSAVGDPACDLVIAWTFLDRHSRAAFRAAMGLPDDAWRRAAGWALWKALITHAAQGASAQVQMEAARVAAEIVAGCMGEH